MSAKFIAVCSGGLDSVTLAYDLAASEKLAGIVVVDYGQRHSREIAYALEAAILLKVKPHHIDLSSLGPKLKGSSQTDRSIPVPHGHYEAESMRTTVVPNRNMILLSVAAGVAIGQGARGIAYAAHGGDHAIYPDCRPGFARAMSEAFRQAHERDQPFVLLAPYLAMTKADIVRRGHELGVPFDRTWSCYEGQDRHCGQCGTCVERREAFALAGVEDPTEYRD